MERKVMLRCFIYIYSLFCIYKSNDKKLGFLSEIHQMIAKISMFL